MPPPKGSTLYPGRIVSEDPIITDIQFSNFRVLRDTHLPLGQFTLIVGPNGSGKSTALKAFHYLAYAGNYSAQTLVSAGIGPDQQSVSIRMKFSVPGLRLDGIWHPSWMGLQWQGSSPEFQRRFGNALAATRVYSFDANILAQPVQLQPNYQLGERGEGLAAVLDRLRDQKPERFESLNAELARWLPEFDRILFDTPGQGARAILLRTRRGHHSIPASDISQGTLLALAILTLAYTPERTAAVVCIEEPDRGIHPRLLREVRDAMYRLAHPQDYGESRPPIQVIATTHSPYMLDLFRDHPEEIVIAHKRDTEAAFERLSERTDLQEIIGEAHLGDVWFSGVLGGVPPEE